MPFIKNDVTKSEEWGMGLGVGNGKVEWRVGHGELGMEYEIGN